MRRKLNQKGFWGVIALGLLGVGLFVGYRVITSGASSPLYNFLRGASIFMDTLVYGLATKAYGIFYEVSSSTLLSSLNLASASQRLYTLLGIFMLFRLAFSFIKYIVNPDGMEKGTSKLLSNLSVSLALIVSVPWIFNRAFELQNYIMDSNVIGNLILGMNIPTGSSENTGSNENINSSSYGSAISFLTFSAFYRVDPTISSLGSCANLLLYYAEDVVPEGDKTVKVENSNGGSNDSEKIAACINALNTLETGNNKNGAELGTILYIASQRLDIGLLSTDALLNSVVGNTYLINYQAIVSTIAGGFLALLFLNYCFDVAVRNAKLCFLQLIAPIPIILNIEPGDAKADKKPLNWWVKECLQTYTMLFIRVATVYFGIFLINMLYASNTKEMSNTSAAFQVFTILGILLFVKQIPDMIGKAFGIDVKGQFNLNPLKRIGDSRIASMALGGAAGLIGGLGTGIAAAASARANGANWGEALRRGVTGGVGGALHSAVSGAKTGAKSIHDITSNVTKNWQRSGRIGGANVGTTLGGRLGSEALMALGAKTAYQREEDKAVALEMPGKKLSEIKNIMNGDKTKVSTGVTIGAGTRKFNSVAEVDDYLNNNSQLTDADRSSLMRARDAFGQVDVLKSKYFTIDGHRYKDLEAAKDAYANDSTLTTDERTQLRAAMIARAKEITAAKSAQSVSLAGQSFDNVKDVYDHVERLKASGASENVIKEAEGQLNIIQGQRWADALSAVAAGGTPNVYSLKRDELQKNYQQNQELYQTYVTDASGTPITNFDVWGNLKTAAGSGNLGSGAVRQGASPAKLNDDAAKARRGGG